MLKCCDLQQRGFDRCYITRCTFQRGLVSLGAIGTSQIVLTPIDLVIAPLLLIHHLNARSLALVVEGVEGRDEEMLVKVGR